MSIVDFDLCMLTLSSFDFLNAESENFGNLKIWKSENLEISKFGNLKIWKSENLKIWKSENLEI